MAVNEDFLKYVLEQLAGLSSVTPRRMFGGVGLYHSERIFGLIFADTLYFKVDDSNRPDVPVARHGAIPPLRGPAPVEHDLLRSAGGCS